MRAILYLLTFMIIVFAFNRNTVAIPPQSPMPYLDVRFNKGFDFVSASDRQLLKKLEADAAALKKTAFLVSVLTSEKTVKIGKLRQSIVVNCLLADGISSDKIYVETLSLERKKAFWGKLSKSMPDFISQIPNDGTGMADVIMVFISPNDPPLRSSASAGGWD